uniref:Membrane protein n=1 Tax=Dikerogammarus haemobaphes virus 1 TaxID=2704946 RepID=A0A6G9HDD1_9VIRU|nr:membrane protein [Dikerogammarus haemobaphes virus 1]
MIKVIAVIFLIVVIAGAVYMWRKGEATSGTAPSPTTPSSGGTQTVVPALPSMNLMGTLVLKDLIPGTKITFKAGWAIDGAFTDNLDSNTNCLALNTCPGGAQTDLVLPQKIKKVHYTNNADETSIGSIQFIYMDNSQSPKYGTAQGTVYFNREISSDTGIRHIWIDKTKTGVLQFIKF